MLHTEYVPQHLLLMACVLRYIMTFTEKRILRRPELDAFIVTAVSPEVNIPLLRNQYLVHLFEESKIFRQVVSFLTLFCLFFLYIKKTSWLEAFGLL